MRLTSLWGLLLCAGIASSCTSVTFTDLSIQQLHEKIAAGEIVRPGETATIVTVDGEQHEIMVSAVRADSVIGRVAAGQASHVDGFEQDQGVTFIDLTIPINDILSVEKVQVTHPAGQAAIATGFGAVYIFLLMLPAILIGAFAL
jgi:hypothetical protein